MFEYIEGKLAQKTPTSVVLDVSGVGYALLIPLSTFSSLPEVGEKTKILTHFVVREDAQILYGFFTEEEKQLFRLLISVSGIGPKMGLMILSGRSHEDLKQAIVDGSVAFLTGISGIGKKTAERLVVELREKVIVDTQLPQSKGSSAGVGSKMEDALSALVQLGYKTPSARQAIEKVLADEKNKKLSVSDLIRESLQHV